MPNQSGNTIEVPAGATITITVSVPDTEETALPRTSTRVQAQTPASVHVPRRVPTVRLAPADSWPADRVPYASQVFLPGAPKATRHSYNRARRVLLTALELYSQSRLVIDESSVRRAGQASVFPPVTEDQILRAASRARVTAPDSPELQTAVKAVLTTLRGFPLGEPTRTGPRRGEQRDAVTRVPQARDRYPAGTTGRVCVGYARARKVVLTVLQLLAMDPTVLTVHVMEEAAARAHVAHPHSAHTREAIGAVLATLRPLTARAAA